MPTVSAAPAKKHELNILVFGNEYLHEVAFMLQNIGSWQGVDFQIAVLASEDGTVENHQYAFKNDFNYCWDRKTGFSYFLDKEHSGGKLNDRDVHSINAKKIIKKKDWDVIVFGASMKYSGYAGTISENLPTFLANIKSVVNDDTVKYLWHEQWALEEKPENIDPDHDFYIYDYNMQDMYEKIKSASATIAQENEFDGIIYTGEVFNVARTKGYSASGKNLLEEIEGNVSMYGKYLAALTWYMGVTGCEINKENLFIPTGVTTGIDKQEAELLVDIATEAVKSKGVTLKKFEDVFSVQEDDKQETTSSELIYNPGNITGDNDSNMDPTLFIIIGAAVVAVAAVVVVVVVVSKKKKSK